MHLEPDSLEGNLLREQAEERQLGRVQAAVIWVAMLMALWLVASDKWTDETRQVHAGHSAAYPGEER